MYWYGATPLGALRRMRFPHKNERRELAPFVHSQPAY
jgi:hypothetical protein